MAFKNHDTLAYRLSQILIKLNEIPFGSIG